MVFANFGTVITVLNHRFRHFRYGYHGSPKTKTWLPRFLTTVLANSGMVITVYPNLGDGYHGFYHFNGRSYVLHATILQNPTIIWADEALKENRVDQGGQYTLCSVGSSKSWHLWTMFYKRKKSTCFFFQQEADLLDGVDLLQTYWGNGKSHVFMWDGEEIAWNDSLTSTNYAAINIWSGDL